MGHNLIIRIILSEKCLGTHANPKNHTNSLSKEDHSMCFKEVDPKIHSHLCRKFSWFSCRKQSTGAMNNCAIKVLSVTPERLCNPHNEVCAIKKIIWLTHKAMF